MIKPNFLTLLICFSCFLTLQSFAAKQQSTITPLKLDSVVTYKFDVNGDSVYDSKTIYKYTSDSLLLAKISYGFISNSTTWRLGSVDSFSYNADKKQTRTLTYRWISSTSGWKPSSKVEISFDGNSVLTNYLNYDTVGNNWIPSSKNKITTDPNSGKTVYSDSYFWNNTEKQWVGSQKIINIFTADYKKSRDTVYSWNSTTQSWTNGMTVKHYDLQEKDTLDVTYQWDEINQKWNLFYKYEFETYTIGQNKFSKTLNCFWNNTKLQWDSAYKSVSYVYGWSVELEYYMYVTHMPANVSEWIQTEKSELKYDSNNRIDSVLSYKYSSNTNQWDTSSITRIEYNDSGQFTYYESYYNYDTLSYKFKNGSKVFMGYDQSGNIALDEEYTFDGVSQTWKGSKKIINETGNPSNSEIYSWNTGNKDWFGVYSFGALRNDDGQTQKSWRKSWDAVNKAWVIAYKDFYYYSAYEAPSAAKSPVVGVQLSQFKVYPNPTRDIIKFNIENITKVDVLSVNGALVKSFSQLQLVDLSSLQSGIYFLKVNTKEGEAQQFKIVKE
jgi:hypothetical protein